MRRARADFITGEIGTCSKKILFQQVERHAAKMAADFSFPERCTRYELIFLAHNERDERAVIWIFATVVIGLLFTCCAGCLAWGASRPFSTTLRLKQCAYLLLPLRLTR